VRGRRGERGGGARPLRRSPAGHGSWRSALALWLYAAAFSEAYVALTAGTGALLLFGAVQLTMLSTAFARGERFRVRQSLGLALAVGGLVVLVLPGVARPALGAALWMALAGVAWGVYTLRGRSARDAIAVNAGNFWRASILALAVGVLRTGSLDFDASGAGYAVASGALASGCGYALWYAVLPRLAATTAATVQLAVPVLAALAGVLLLGEPLTVRLAVASVAVLGGVAATLRR
jgi:drug/metabolite transporter (DMT)-like permease